MADLTKSLAVMLAMGLGSAALAQDASTPPAAPATEAPAAGTPATDAPAPAAEAPAAQAPAEPDPNAPGTPYVKETFDAWSLQCIRTQDGNDPCQIYQLMKDSAGNSVADISIQNLPEGQKAAAGATIMTPLETDLAQNLVLAIDTGAPKGYPFRFCARVGCFVQAGFTAEELDAMRKGNKVTVSLAAMAAPQQKVDLDLSLKGFTAAYEAMVEANAKLMKK